MDIVYIVVYRRDCTLCTLQCTDVTVYIVYIVYVLQCTDVTVYIVYIVVYRRDCVQTEGGDRWGSPATSLSSWLRHLPR